MSDDAFPEAYPRSNDWTPPDQDGGTFVAAHPGSPQPTVSEYGHPFYAPPLTTPTSGYATASLILGLATFATLGITGVLAIVFGHLATRETKTGARAGHGMAIAGLILGYLSIALWALLLLALGTISAEGAGGSA